MNYNNDHKKERKQQKTKGTGRKYWYTTKRKERKIMKIKMKTAKNKKNRVTKRSRKEKKGNEEI